jgi:hypothetical protein
MSVPSDRPADRPTDIDFERLRAQIWQQLQQAVGDREHEWRTPVLAGIDADGLPQARTVVLRRADPIASTLQVYTDSRSPKVDELLGQPDAVLVFWSRRLSWQLRARVTVQVLTEGDLVEAAYTLGVGDRGLIRRVLIPGAAPEIAETLRMVLGWAWTYVIVAELIGASSGIGHMITDSQALLATDQIIFGIIVIGIIGLASDLLFKTLNRRLFPWARL